MKYERGVRRRVVYYVQIIIKKKYSTQMNRVLFPRSVTSSIINPIDSKNVKY